MFRAPETICELAQRWQIEDEAEAARVRFAVKYDEAKRAGQPLGLAAINLQNFNGGAYFAASEAAS